MAFARSFVLSSAFSNSWKAATPSSTAFLVFSGTSVGRLRLGEGGAVHLLASGGGAPPPPGLGAGFFSSGPSAAKVARAREARIAVRNLPIRFMRFEPYRDAPRMENHDSR